MATKETNLAIQSRDRLGTTGSNALRHAGKVPAVVYGHGTAAEHVAVDAQALHDLLHRSGRNAIVTLSGGAQKSETALLRAVAYHPTSQKVLHVDFQRVSANESITARLPIVTVGVARGIRDSGGVMDVINHEVEIEGPANRIPDHVEIDVSELGIHDRISAAAVILPDGFAMVTPPETTIVAIEASRTQRDLEEAASGISETAEPEVIGAATPAKPE